MGRGGSHRGGMGAGGKGGRGKKGGSIGATGGRGRRWGSMCVYLGAWHGKGGETGRRVLPGSGKILEWPPGRRGGAVQPPSKFIKENGWGRELPESSHFASLPAYELPKNGLNCQELPRNCQPNCQNSCHKTPLPRPKIFNKTTSSAQHVWEMSCTSNTKAQQIGDRFTRR